MTAVHVALLVLTAARLTRFVVTDDLGQHVLVFPIVRLASRIPDRHAWLLEGLECTWCMSVWASSACYVLYRFVPWSVTGFLFWPLAVSYIVGVMSRWLEG